MRDYLEQIFIGVVVSIIVLAITAIVSINGLSKDIEFLKYQISDLKEEIRELRGKDDGVSLETVIDSLESISDRLDEFPPSYAETTQ
jgi:hypothetical protein